jgi:hypothetical protein
VLADDYGRVIAQAVSRRNLATKAREGAVEAMGIFYGKTKPVTGFYPSPSVSFLVNIIPPMLHIYSCIIWGMDIGPVSGRSSIHTHTITTITNILNELDISLITKKY